ncbi:MAG: ornithine cyclodeaminase [Gammaproteobacteria bacterium]
MTRFIDVTTLGKLVAKVGATDFMAGMSEAVREDFVRWPQFDKSPRSACHSDVGVIELMPVANAEQYAFKYVNGHPSNTELGLSTVMAFGALAEVKTGYPLLLSELTLTTAFRTAATSTMAAKALAREDSKVMALIGAGAQSEFQALAFHSQLGIETVRVFDVDRLAMEKLAANLSHVSGLEVVFCDSTAEAVRGADIVTTATADKAWATIITPDMLEPGMHLNAIGGDCPGKTELHADVLRAGKVFVEYEPQTRVEGDIQQLDAQEPVFDLWRVLDEQIDGRDAKEQITIFDSVGFALEDYSALRYLYELSGKLGMGRPIELVPELEDPKDLFRLTLDHSATSHVSKVA